MGLFDSLFKKAPAPSGEQQGLFRTLTAYSPVFTSWGGSIYESELVRSAIHARANHISKLKVEITGAAKPSLRSKLRQGPNEFQTWGQFLYRLSTILDVNNTAFIVPIFDEYGEVSGVYPVLPSRCELVQYGGQPWIRYEFSSGQHASIELSACGIMTKMQYEDDYFGTSNGALFSTMELINVQNQAINEGAKSSATYRFMAKLTNFAKPEDLAKERKRFNTENFASGEGGGVILWPNTYTDIQQIQSKPFVVDAEQRRIINENVYNYFGVNSDILQNKAFGDAWSAFYEGAIEAFSVQFSDVMTRMLFTLRERAAGSCVIATANRLQYMSNKDKLEVSAQMADRGLMSINEVREIWNLPPVEGGDKRPIRGEYYMIGEEEENDGNAGNEGDQSV